MVELQPPQGVDVDARDVLLVLRNDGALLPVYRGGLGQADGWPWAIVKLYKGALVVTLSGVATMDEVEIVGPAGSSMLARVFSVLNSNWNIAIRLNEAQMGVEGIVHAVGKGLLANVAARRALFDLSEAELIAQVERAKSIAELFQVLGIDRPDFVALDSL